MSLILDMFTMGLAAYVIYQCLGKRWNLKNSLILLSAATYLTAQSGWATSFLTGNLWGALYNNYIWFIFNTLVMSYFIIENRK